MLCCEAPALLWSPRPAFQVEVKAVAQNEKSWTDVPGVSPPVRLVVTATPQSQVSNDPILGNDTAPGRSAETPYGKWLAIPNS